MGLVRAMKRINEIKIKREKQFIRNRYVHPRTLWIYLPLSIPRHLYSCMQADLFISLTPPFFSRAQVYAITTIILLPACLMATYIPG